jgi:hypothetical protein
MTTAVTVDSVIRAYMKLRAQRDVIEAETKEKLSLVKANMGKLEAWLMAKADADGVTSFKTDHGTAFLTTTDFANVEDWDAVLSFIKQEDAFDMLERRVSKTAVRAYIDATKAVPPGVKYGTKLDINIRKPTGGS